MFVIECYFRMVWSFTINHIVVLVIKIIQWTVNRIQWYSHRGQDTNLKVQVNNVDFDHGGTGQ